MIYLNDINQFGEKDNNKDNKYKEKNIKKEKDIEHNNTFNINLNFISNPKSDINKKRISTNASINHLNLKGYNNLNINNIESTEENQNNINLRNSSNINHIKSPKLKNLFSNSYKIINTKNDNIPFRNKSYRHRKIIKTSKTSIYENKEEEFEEIFHNNNDIIQIEDLLILEGKILHLISCLKYENPLPKMCIEW